MDFLSAEYFQAMNTLELALWILECRNAVNKNSFESDVARYSSSVNYLCMDWEKHYLDNVKFYQNQKFKKAIILLGRMPKFKFVIDYGGGKQDITNRIYQRNFGLHPENRFYKIAVSLLNDDLDFYKYTFEQCFRDSQTYKSKLFEIISEQYFMQPYVRIRVFENGKWFKASTYADFLKQCETLTNYKVEYEKRNMNRSYITSLKEFGIPKTIFFDFMNSNTCEKEFDKKLFVNLAFALSLPYQYFDKLLHYNGLAFKESTRQFDVVCEKAFRIGFGREYTKAIIDKYNLDRCAQVSNFVPVPNI